MPNVNIHQLKQYIGNNLWYGEAVRRHPANRLPIVQSVMDGETVFGVDVSHWQIPPVDFVTLRDVYNCRFVIIKGCDGSLNTKYYNEHKQAAKDAGLVWGMYAWLYRPVNVNIDAQINTWHARYSDDPPPMGIYIDCEWTSYGGVASNPNSSDLRLAHDKWFAKSGNRATTYTAPGYANTYLTSFDWSREELWVAHYGVTVPTLPKGATTYIIHQYTSQFKLDGRNLDGNHFNGTLQEFQNRYGVQPPTGGTMKYTATALADGTRLRSDHNVNNTYIGTYPKGTLFHGDVLYVAPDNNTPNQQQGDTWLQVSLVGNTPKNGWVAITHLGKPICSLVENNVPPPAESRVLTVTVEEAGWQSVTVEVTQNKL